MTKNNRVKFKTGKNIDGAKKYFKRKCVIRRDEIEKLPNDFTGFWITSPSDIIHLITEA